MECATDGAWCARSGDCLTVGLWQEIHRAVSAVVDGTTLADLLAKQAGRKEPT